MAEQSSTETSKPPASNNSVTTGSIVSSQFIKGETDVQRNVLDLVANEIQKQLNRFLMYFITTILVAGVVVIWTMNSRISELEGKYASPDKTIETLGSRLEVLEKSNKELTEKNFQLEIEKLKLELTQKNIEK